MNLFDKYSAVIFDCDGVIFDSNSMKIDIMQEVLLSNGIAPSIVDVSIEYFSKNFGKSRIQHIDHIVDEILKIQNPSNSVLKQALINSYSQKVQEGYTQIPLVKGITELLDKMSNKELFVASGSDQEELISVFEKLRIDIYFNLILGGPTSKSENVRRILTGCYGKPVLLIGDSFSDYEAAKANHIDFAFFPPYSNVKEDMLSLARSEGFKVINDFEEIL